MVGGGTTSENDGALITTACNDERSTTMCDWIEGERRACPRSELTFCSKVRHGYIERSRKKPSARAFCCAEVTCPPCFLGFLAIVDVRASPKLE